MHVHCAQQSMVLDDPSMATVYGFHGLRLAVSCILLSLPGACLVSLLHMRMSGSMHAGQQVIDAHDWGAAGLTPPLWTSDGAAVLVNF